MRLSSRDASLKTRFAGSLLGAFVLVLLCGPGVAFASPTWLPHADISAATEPAGAELDLAVDGQGDSVAVWVRNLGSGGVLESSFRPAGGEWSTPAVVTTTEGQTEVTLRYPHVAIDSAGEAVAVWSRYEYETEDFLVQSASRSTDGSWSAPVALTAPGESGLVPSLAMDAAGEAVVAWERYPGGAVHAVDRPADGQWDAPVALAAGNGGNSDPEVAIDAAGEAAVVWSEGMTVESAEHPASGPWGAPVEVVSGGTTSPQPRLAMNGVGDEIVVWKSSPDSLAVAERVGGGNWGAPTEVASETVQTVQPRVAIDPAGDAFVTWINLSEPILYIRGTSKPVGGQWTAPSGVPAGIGAAEPQVATSPAGNAIAVWNSSQPSGYHVEGAELSVTGGWSDVAELSEGGEAAAGPQIATDEGGDAVTVWSHRENGEEVIQGAALDGAAPVLGGLSVPTTATVGQAISFSTTPFDAWSALTPTTWSFGDGAAAAGDSVTHAYAEPGSHQVTVGAADAVGNAATTTRTIVVSAAPAAPAPPTSVATGAAATTPPTPQTLRLRKLRRNSKKGTATLIVEVSGRGTVRLGGAKIASVTRLSGGAGVVRLVVRATGGAKQQLAKKGRLSVKLKVSFRPSVGGPTIRKMKVVRLEETKN